MKVEEVINETISLIDKTLRDEKRKVAIWSLILAKKLLEEDEKYKEMFRELIKTKE